MIQVDPSFSLKQGLLVDDVIEDVDVGLFGVVCWENIAAGAGEFKAHEYGRGEHFRGSDKKENKL